MPVETAPYLLITGLAVAVTLLLYRLRKLEKIVKELTEFIEYVVAPKYRILGQAVAALSTSARCLRALEKASKKPRRRYIAFYIVTEDGKAPDPRELERSIRESLERLAGLIGVAESNISLVYYDPEKPAGIIRATNTTKYLVLAALGLTRRVGRKRVLLVPVRTAGTIKRAKKAIQLIR